MVMRDKMGFRVYFLGFIYFNKIIKQNELQHIAMLVTLPHGKKRITLLQVNKPEFLSKAYH